MKLSPGELLLVEWIFRHGTWSPPEIRTHSSERAVRLLDKLSLAGWVRQEAGAYRLTALAKELLRARR